MAKAVIGIARSEEQAARIVNQLKEAGFSSDDVSLLLPDRGGQRDFAHEYHSKAPEGATAGVVAGGVIAGALGWLAGIGTIAIPGIGALVAAGPVMAALSGVAAGGAIGGIAGALVGYGFPEYEAKQYEGRVKNGNILISVHTEDSRERSTATEIFDDANAEDISYTGEARV
jgi:hypothetical protein